MATRREYLISLGLAKEGRGKFSAAGVAALEKAVSEGVVFDEPAKPAPKEKVAKTDAPADAPKPGPVRPAPVAQVKTAVLPSTPKVDVDAKAVRSWAKQNGHEVGDRGRIHASVIQAFLNAGGKPRVQAAKPVAQAPAVQVRPERTGWTFWKRGKGEASF